MSIQINNNSTNYTINNNNKNLQRLHYRDVDDHTNQRSKQQQLHEQSQVHQMLAWQFMQSSEN